VFERVVISTTGVVFKPVISRLHSQVETPRQSYRKRKNDAPLDRIVSQVIGAGCELDIRQNTKRRPAPVVSPEIVLQARREIAHARSRDGPAGEFAAHMQVAVEYQSNLEVVQYADTNVKRRHVPRSRPDAFRAVVGKRYHTHFQLNVACV